MKKKLSIFAGLALAVAFVAQVLTMSLFKIGLANLLLNLLSLVTIVIAIFLAFRAATYIETVRQGEDWKTIIEEETQNEPQQTKQALKHEK